MSDKRLIGSFADMLTTSKCLSRISTITLRTVGKLTGLQTAKGCYAVACCCLVTRTQGCVTGYTPAYSWYCCDPGSGHEYYCREGTNPNGQACSAAERQTGICVRPPA